PAFSCGDRKPFYLLALPPVDAGAFPKPQFVTVLKDQGSIFRNAPQTERSEFSVGEPVRAMAGVKDNTPVAVIEKARSGASGKFSRIGGHGKLALLVVKHGAVLCLEP